MVGIDPQAQTLVDEYLNCLRRQTAVNTEVIAAKEKLLAYSQKIRRKILRSATASVTVSVQPRTVFPQYNQPGRKEVEAAVKAAGWWDKSQSFDILRLAEDYDAGRLPAELKSRLGTWAKSETKVRLFVNEPASQTSL